MIQTQTNMSTKKLGILLTSLFFVLVISIILVFSNENDTPTEIITSTDIQPISELTDNTIPQKNTPTNHTLNLSDTIKSSEGFN